VAENSAKGTVVGHVTVEAANGATPAFTLVNNPGNLFAIDASGVITLTGNGPLDFEKASSYGISVKVVDQATGQSFTKDFTINVSNVNEVPIIDSLSPNSVLGLGAAPNGTPVVHASDPDAGDVLTYSFKVNADGTLANGNGAFAIDSKTGQITVADSSKLIPGTDSVTVDVTDRDGLSVERTFNINVQDPATQLVAANEHRTADEDHSVVIQAAAHAQAGARASPQSIGAANPAPWLGSSPAERQGDRPCLRHSLTAAL
jgi:hypothetical protein